MSSKFGPSLLAKSFKLIFKHAKSFNKDTVKLIGQDHLGNKYFEARRPNHPRPLQRYFDRVTPPKSFEEVVDAAHVPPAWDAWLRFRRQEPPTEEEVLEGEKYYHMQQELAAEKKRKDSPKNSTNS